VRTTFTITRGFKALLLAGGASAIALATPANAQNQAGADEDEDAPIVVTGTRILRKDYENNSPTVTVDEEFLRSGTTSAVEQQLNKLPQFVVSQSSTASNNSETGLLPAGGDIQPNATNTPGAATVSLRGVGANRTLVLIDGRRGVPGNASGAVDVSTIPNAALERVEIISGGASATYGADAVAGVTNFILKSDFEGLELDGSMGFDQRGNGFEYQLGGIMGADFDDGRGNVSIAMSMNTRELMLQADNPFYQDLWNNPDTTSGAFFFVPRPGISGIGLQANGTGPANCEQLPQGCVLTNMFPGANPAVPNNTGAVQVNQDGTLFIGSAGFAGAYAERGGGAFLKPWAERDAETGAVWAMKSNGRLYAYNALTPQTVPTTRYNFLARGNYEINDWVGVFAQGMFSNSTTYTVQEAGGAQFGWDVIIPWGTGVYTGTVPGIFNNYTNPAVPSSVIRNGDTFNFVPYADATPGNLADNPTNPAFTALYGGANPILACANSAVGGCTNTQAFEAVVPASIETLLAARPNPNGTVSLAGFLPNPRENYSDVTTYSLVAGLEGYVPGTDWTWELFVNHGLSRTLSRQTGMYSMQRLRAVFTAPNFGQGFRFQSNQFAGLGGLSPGFGAATGRCTSGLNFFGGYQGISEDCRDAIAEDNTNTATSRQTIVEANLQGKVIDLPAGELRAAIGASYRESRFEFLPDGAASSGRAFLDSIVGIYPGTRMEMQGIDAKELYGELLIPVLHDLPFVQAFNLEVGGRMSNYSTTGTSYTWKILGDWQVNDWLRFRGGFNRAERMPNIAELLLTPQQAFGTEVIGDVCSTRHNNPLSANPTANTTNSYDVQAMCLELMARDNNGTYVPVTDPNSYYAAGQEQARQPTGGGGFTFATSVGNQYYRENIDPNYAPLKSEIADTWTAGMVIQSPADSGPLSRLNLAIDYFNIRIKDPISRLGEGAQLLRCISPAFNPAVDGVAQGATSAAALNTPAVRAAAQAALAAGSTCASVFRNTSVGQGQNGQVNSPRMIGSYGNDGEIRLSGIDANLSWSTDLGPGTLFLSLNGNYMIDFKVQSMSGQPFVDYVGTTGTTALGVNSGSSFEYRIFGNIGYRWGPANVGIQWQHIPATEDGNEANFLNGLAPAGTDASGLPAYNLFSLNAGYEVTDNLSVRLGIDNLFNKRPPLTNVDVNINTAAGELPGGGYSLFHDVQGRRFSLGANVQF
jgi:iron complex outermembrane receptor protein